MINVTWYEVFSICWQLPVSLNWLFSMQIDIFENSKLSKLSLRRRGHQIFNVITMTTGIRSFSAVDAILILQVLTDFIEGLRNGKEKSFKKAVLVQ